MTLRAFALACALLAAGLAAGSPRADEAAFRLEAFFAGETASTGTIDVVFSEPEPFTASLSGSVRDGVLRLDERFAFADGEALQRWILAPDGAGGYVGTVETQTRDGVLRPPRPVTASPAGPGFVLAYDGYAPDGGGTVVHFRHEMRPLPGGRVENRVAISKLGLPLAHAEVVFAPAGAGRR